MTPELICVVGPTAIGKTALSIELARRYSTEIISADSRQFYKEMSIGTAVPSPIELSMAKHHFIQHISITEDYNVGKFETQAIKVLRGIHKTNSKAILVGGSGLYQKAVTEGLDYFPDIPISIRQKYNTLLEKEGIEALRILLKKKDLKTYETIEKSNARRLTRALEVIDVSGKPFSNFQAQEKQKRDFDVKKIGLDAPRTIIYERIEKRVDLMIEDGLIDEARALHPQRHLNALQTVGYKELFRHFDGNCSLAEAIDEIKKNTRRYAKRQLTWFKKDPEIQWFRYLTPPSDITKALEKMKN
ncbi:tRNA (adenosine(37)-N6)-dimethylallyltransferase MiaA [Psychroflexus tropicus]|uniref:tRNA (adenosine(37)-N6)-dimethylallyltransferase MiaA n=1 Tax=Psychroflexus tropicus TaxID=197345 RepID=UPI0003702AF5|nr:tRNA (adenosine(37)-N6)-dimethylallyltransferase MiaA [Psychroflexus tropicus]